jgi:large subunit ribosomal protein L28
MAICEISGKRPRVKNLVSHSNIKTKKRANPNVQSKNLYSMSLGKMVRLAVSTSAIKSVDHVGGLDRYLLKQKTEVLSPRALKVRNQILRKMNEKNA